MRTQQIDICRKAYAALLAACSKSVLAQDAPPIRIAEIEPMLKGDFRRSEIERALASKLKGRLAADIANPTDVARKLLDMLHEPGKEPDMNDDSRSRRSARDGLSAELQKTLRGKLSPQEYDAIMAAIGNGNREDDMPKEETDYQRQQFGAAPPRDPDDDEPENDGYNAAVAKPGEFAKDNGALADKIMSFVGPHLTDEDRDGLQKLLDSALGGEDDTAEDDPPAFGGQPLVGGKLRPLSAKRNPAQDAKVARYASKVREEARQSFDKRFPEAARIAGEPQRQYRDGMPVHDPRLLTGTTDLPRRHAAMDNASSVRSAKSFAERFPDAARIRVEG